MRIRAHVLGVRTCVRAYIIYTRVYK